MKFLKNFATESHRRDTEKNSVKFCEILWLILFFCQLLFAQQSPDLYFNTVRDKYVGGDFVGAASDIKESKQLGKNDEEIKTLSAQVATSFFTAACEKYTAGDLFGAVNYFEAGLELKDDQSAKDIFGLCLSEIVYKFYSQKKDYQAAIPYLEKLTALFPADEEYKKMYETAKRNIIRGVEALPGVAPKKDTKQIEQLFELMETRLQKQEKLLSGYSAKQQQLVGRIIDNARKEKDEFLSQIKSEIENENKKTKNIFVFSTSAAVGSVIFITFFLVFLLARYLKSGSSVIVFSNRKNAMETLSKTAKRLKMSDAKKEEKIIDAEPLSEKMALSIIEKEMFANHSPISDTPAAEGILNSFLESKNSDIAAKAAVSLYNYNPEKALTVLEKLLSESDEQKRLAAVRALGEIASSVAINMLLSNLSGAGKSVQRETIKMLRNIMVMKKSDITDELQKKIKNTLYSMKDTWIIE